jgi:hypothetical protein
MRSAPGAGRLRLGVLALAVLAGAACGKKGPPIYPEMRLPRPVADLAGLVEDGAIQLTWTNPRQRADGTRLRALGAAHVFRYETAGDDEPKVAVLERGRVAWYTEVGTIRLDLPPPAAGQPPPAGPARVDGERVRFTDRDRLVPGHRYTYVVTVEDLQGRMSPPSPRVTVAFVAPPETPTALRAEAGDHQVRLSWTPSARFIDGTPAADVGYEILRGAAAESVTELVTPRPIDAAEFVDRSVENDRTYFYAVRPVRRTVAGLARGEPSKPVSATPLDLTPPAPPTDLVATATTGTVRLSWRPSPDADVAAYIVYRAAPGGAFVRVGSVRAPGTVFTDRDVPAGPWRYAVSAQDSSSRANESARSTEVGVTVP